MPAFFAFLHHVAAFTLVSALVIEHVHLHGELNLRTARRLQVADLVFGAAAGVILAVGIPRVLFFETGVPYYTHSAAFIAKMVLFVSVALLSIYPTMEIFSWRRALKEGRVPAVSERKMRAMRRLVQCELAGIVLILACAAMMAKGVGYFGG
jgi:putative membrane protein